MSIAYDINIVAHTAFPVGEKDAEVLLLELSFESGLPEYYQLPLLFVNGEEAKEISDKHPSAVITQLKIGNREGLLCDALYTEDYRNTLLHFMAGGKRFMASGEVVFSSTQELQQFIENNRELHSRVQATSEMHTAIVFNNQYFLKAYRKVDRGMHPDVELTRYFTEAGSTHTTKYLGSIEWRLSGGSFFPWHVGKAGRKPWGWPSLHAGESCQFH